MNLAAVLALGFFLGMRHATDADHVVAVSNIVTRERTLRAAAPIGALWGLGHTLTILLVGGAIVLFGIVIPPRLGLGMELSVAIMLVLLGALNVKSVLQDVRSIASAHGAQHLHALPHDHAVPHLHAPHGHAHPLDRTGPAAPRSWRPLFVGIVHGLAGSAAVALLVLGAIGDPLWALGYLLVFGVGTIAGMVLITTAIAVPITVAAQKFARFHRAL
ncbi:MAG TPA: high-affinity nickel-transport family protein, partial [Polyangiaceae bacterium]|nr:high-affinity nickel-transport family protein [Polyangiaceae bacterium]